MDARFEKSLDWGKVDPNLAASISGATNCEQRVKILLSINGKPGPGSLRWMKELGVRVGPRTLHDGENTVTADATLDGIRRLSKRPYVRRLVPARAV